MSKTAINAMLLYMEDVYGNPSSLHSVGQKANEALVNAREHIAKLLGCEAREITFTSGGSESDNQAIVSAARIGEKSGKKHIVSTAFEHHAVLHTLEKLKKEGFEITLLDVHESGLVTPEQVGEAIREDTCLVTIMYATAGRLHIDVKEQNIDMLSLSAHKFHGPKGMGVYASSGSACTSGSLDPSHVLLAIGRVHDIAHGSLRLTLSEENTEEEIEYTINAVKEVVEYLRSISPIWRDLVNGKKEFIIK